MAFERLTPGYIRYARIYLCKNMRAFVFVVGKCRREENMRGSLLIRQHVIQEVIWETTSFWTIYFILRSLLLSRLNGRWAQVWFQSETMLLVFQFLHFLHKFAFSYARVGILGIKNWFFLCFFCMYIYTVYSTHSWSLRPTWKIEISYSLFSEKSLINDPMIENCSEPL